MWLYDRLAPRVPAGLAGWRSGDLLARAIDDVDALQDLYLRSLLPMAIAVGASVIGTVAVGLILPRAALALGLPLAVALIVPALLTWRRGGDEEMAALSGTLSAKVVDALGGTPELLAFGAADATLRAIEELGERAAALERRHARLATATALVIGVCLAAAVVGVLALGVAAVHAHQLGQVMVAVLPLAALATFETVPGVPLAVARALAVRASAERLFALEDVPVPVRDPAAAEPRAPGVPEVAFEDAALRYGPGLPRALDGISLRLPPGGRLAVTGSSGAGKSSLVNALMRYWPLEAGRPLARWDKRGAPHPGRRPGCVRTGGPACPDVRGHGALEPHPRPARRHRGRDRGSPARGASRRVGGDAAPRSRDPGRRGRSGALGRRAPTPRRGPRRSSPRDRWSSSTSPRAASTRTWPTS